MCPDFYVTDDTKRRCVPAPKCTGDFQYMTKWGTCVECADWHHPDATKTHCVNGHACKEKTWSYMKPEGTCTACEVNHFPYLTGRVCVRMRCGNPYQILKHDG